MTPGLVNVQSLAVAAKARSRPVEGSAGLCDIEDLHAEQRCLHGSRERIPAASVRAMARVALEKELFPSVGALARNLQLVLRSEGITYDVRTLKRQMLGGIATVAPEVAAALLRVLVDGSRRRSGSSIRKLLTKQGVNATRMGEPPYLLAVKVLPLVHLWLHLNPGSSKRALASHLQKDLEQEGISYALGSLEAILAGKNRLFVSRTIRDRLLTYLSERRLGEAEGRIEDLSEDILRSLAMRQLIPIRRFRDVCLLWLWEHRGASPRQLAMLLRQELLQRGVQMSLDYLQRMVADRPRKVRRLLETALEEVLQKESSRPRDLEAALARTARERERLKLDMDWVRPEPIVALAKAWLENDLGSSMRQLALRLASTIEHMGYSMSHNSIQPILGGWKKKTRRFVYRAMLFECTNMKCATRSCVLPAVRDGLCRICWLRMHEPRYFERREVRQNSLWR